MGRGEGTPKGRTRIVAERHGPEVARLRFAVDVLAALVPQLRPEQIGGRPAASAIALIASGADPKALRSLGQAELLADLAWINSKCTVTQLESTAEALGISPDPFVRWIMDIWLERRLIDPPA